MMEKYLKESFKYLLRSKPLIRREIKHVKNLYSLNEIELKRYKEQQFLKIFKRAYKKSSFYREFYSDFGISENDIQVLEDIVKLPVLTKDLIRENHEKMLTVPKWKVKSANTSGTTGSPLTVYHSYKALRLEQAYIWVRRYLYGFTYGDKLASLRGNLTREEFKLFVHASKTLYLSSYNINEKMADKYYEELKTFKPKAIEGYPSSLYNLSLIFKEKGWKLEIPYCFTSSETLFQFQRRLIENVFGTQIYDRYGCTERTVSIAENINHDGYYEEPGYSINEFKPESILTTSLINQHFPLIRYQVNDIVELNDENMIIDIAGRKEDNVICKDGSAIGRLDHLFKNVKNVRLAQILQYQKGQVVINVVPANEKLSDTVKNYIYSKAIERFGEGNMIVEINEVSPKEIVYTDRGKFNLVKSFI